MKRFRTNILTLLGLLSSALLAALLPACTDEIEYPSPAVDDIPDGITLRIPDPKGVAEAMETRSETADLAQKEGTINTLYLLMFKPGNNGATAKTYILPLTDGTKKTADSDHSDNVGYMEYDLTETLKNDLGNDLNGTWNFYVAANIDPYIENTLEDLDDEAAMKALRLNFIKTEGTKKTYLLDPTVALTSDYGLPMVAHTQNIYVKDKDGESLGSQGVSLSTSSNCVIHADLQFLCSKVRTTVFFNSEDEDFSKNIFEGMSFALENDGGIIAKTVPNQASGLLSEDTESSRTNEDLKYPFNTYAFPTNASAYPTDTDKNKALTGSGAFGKMAFQGTFYLPENASTDAATSLVFKGHTVYKDASNSDALTNGPTLTYTMPLLPLEDDGTTAIARGMYYDIAAKITGVDKLEFTKFEPAPWTPKNLVYSLLPPTFLHVESTQITVEAGVPVELWYDSNVEVTGKSPEYGGKPLYVITPNPNTKTVTVNVNSAISTSDFKDITDHLDEYNFFYLEAGNIREKINITNLILRRFITVDPGDLTIDARDRISSGEYSGERYIKIYTNVASLELTTTDWYNSLNSGNIEIWDGTTQLWTTSANTKRPIDMDGRNGLVTLTVKFMNVNSGNDYWDLKRIKNFKVIPENNNIQTTDPQYLNPESVKVTTEPNNDNYTIYFRAEDEKWKNPHIYVYQCLELPGNTGEKEVGISGKTGKFKQNLSSYPVGYKDGDVAALEYCFTGAIAFKGWDSPDNKDALTSLDGKWGDDKRGYTKNSFYMFDGCNGEDVDWNASKDKSSNRYFKGSKADFAKKFRNEIKSKGLCSSCENTPNGQLWPGIRMIPETIDGVEWYRFELSGIATPGKALIMFTDVNTDDHGNAVDDASYPADKTKDHNKRRRYPNHEENGIPLFDYPNRTGYFVLKSNGAGGAFTNTPDGSSQNDEITDYLIRWPQAMDGKNFWNINVSYEGGGCPFGFTGTDNWKTNMGYDNGIYIVNFNSAPQTGKLLKIKVQAPKTTNTDWPYNNDDVYYVNKTITAASFDKTENYQGKTYRVLTLRSSDFTAADPGPVDPPNPPTDYYMIKWPAYINASNYNFYQVKVEYADGSNCDRFNGNFIPISGSNKAVETKGDKITETNYFWCSNEDVDESQSKIFGYAFKTAPTQAIKITIKNNSNTELEATGTFTTAQFTGSHTNDGKTYKVLNLTKSNFDVSSDEDSGKTVPSGTYRIYWKKTLGTSNTYTKIKYWPGGGDNQTASYDGEVGNYYYKNFTSNKVHFQFLTADEANSYNADMNGSWFQLNNDNDWGSATGGGKAVYYNNSSKNTGIPSNFNAVRRKPGW